MGEDKKSFLSKVPGFRSGKVMKIKNNIGDKLGTEYSPQQGNLGNYKDGQKKEPL